MPVVTSIAESRGMVEITADGRAFLRLPKIHFEKCPLLEGQEFDEAAYIARVASAQLADAYEAALSSLDRSDRTRHQIADALRRKGYVPPVIDAVTERLKDNRLIDDARFARRMAETSSGGATGVYALKRKMKAKGICDEDIEAAVAGLDADQQAEAALRAARPLLRKYEGLPPRQARAKLSQALARRGFGWEAVERAVEELVENEE